MKIKNNKNASIIVLALILVGFLLVLSVGVMRVILTESNDTYGMKNSLKAYYGAESALELALLKLKIKGFGYNATLNQEEKGESAVLVGNLSKIKRNKDILISYNIKSSSSSASGTLDSGESDIYQLFYLEGSNDFGTGVTEERASSIKLDISGTGDEKNVSWSIISRSKEEDFNINGSSISIKTSGLNGTGGIDTNTEGFGKGFNVYNDRLVAFKENVGDFLLGHSGSFLMIGNFNNSGSVIDYSLTAGDGKKITGRYTTITASAQVGDKKQNIEMKIDNAKYLNIIRNVLYSKN